MDVIVLNDQLAAWDEFVQAHQHASNYHQVGWKNVVEQSFGHQTRYLLAIDRGAVVGVLPLTIMKSLFFGRSVVSLPFLNYGGVLATNAEAEKALVTFACSIAKEERAKYLELRHFEPLGYGLVPKRHKVTMILSLASEVEDQWKRFDAKVRNQIRKALKSGLQAECGGEELLDAFYSIFARNMRDLGTPVYGRIFFESILKNFPLNTKIFVINHCGRPIAAGLAIVFKDTMEVPWAGSLTECRSLCPNMLLYWEAIQYGIEHGLEKFDFGRSTPEEGTYRFKAQWGARAYPLVWEYWTADGGSLPNISPKNPKFSLVINIWKRLPLAMANFLGPRIVRAIP